MYRVERVTDAPDESEALPAFDEFLWPLSDYVWAVPSVFAATRPLEDSRSDTAARKPAVLVVEDDQETQVFMQILLGREYEVFFAASGEEVRNQLSRLGRVRIILMDLSLKGPEDGLMITRDLRSDHRFRGLPIIAVTAHAYTEDRARTLEAGCDDFVAKPFEPRDLLSRMKQLQ